MKKKVVALLTLAMFVMTLLPVAAFAGTVQAVPQNSRVSFDIEKTNPTIDTDENLVVEPHLFVDKYDQNPKDQYVVMENTAICVKDADGNVVVDATIGLVDEDGEFLTTATQWEMKDGYAVDGSSTDGYKAVTLKNGKKFGVNVPTSGEYTLEVEQIQKDAAGNEKYVPVKYKHGQQFTVDTVAEDSMTFVGEENAPIQVDTNENVVTLTRTDLEKTNFEYNGVDTYKVTGTLLDEKKNPMTDKEVTLSSNKDNLVLEDETVTTDNKGEFDIEFSLNDEVNATVTITYGDLEYTLKVDGADESDYENITTTKEGGYVLSGKDTKNYAQASKYFSTAVQFEITDENGNVQEGNLPSSELASVVGANHNKYVKVNAPKNSTLKPESLVLAWDPEEEVYTLKYVGTNPKKDLVEGEYTVTVALLNGDSAKATFNVAKFGDVKDLTIKTYYSNYNNTNLVSTDDEIALGDNLLVAVKYVDENGIEINAANEDLKVGAEGKAIDKKVKPFDLQWAAGYALKADSTVNESLIGTTIKVTAFDSKEKKLATKELTVVDAYKTYSLSFDNNEGKVNTDNNVKVSVVDKNDKVAETVKGDVYAYVDSQSNKDAKVTVETVDNAYKGKFNIKVYANQPTTADIVVGVRTSDAKIYAGTLTYTFGEESIPAGTSVVMTLGSTEMIVNNQLVDMKDAAPFAQDNRTFVPFRALGEALGATVDYDQTAKTVTYKLGSSEIVMTLGSKDYTVNGVKKTMDVAPFAKDNRTYVPVRFVGEGLGFTVTGLTNANGQYVAVAFTK